tara:strand:+ start:343 stop:879 length:537 start_codon:yes stop_codon:yes gene_type:complete
MLIEENNSCLINRDVLVLNANYVPLTICSAKRAICLNYLKKIEILVNYDEIIRSPTTAFNLPSVIKTMEYINFNNITVDLTRKNILVRDDYTCQYCSIRNHYLTIDHIIPKFRGGQEAWDNLVVACKPCNQKKGIKSLAESNMELIKLPKRPNRIQYFQKFVKQKQSGWKPYLFMKTF